MGKNLVSITFYATLRGTIWQGIEASKEIQRIFTPEKHVFTEKWEGLKKALSLLTDDGDFQNCAISWGAMVVKWFDGKYFLELQADIPNCKLTREFLAEA